MGSNGLKLQSDCVAQKRSNGGHGAARGDEHRHELGAADLFVSEVNGGTEIAKLQVIRKFVSGREAARWATEFAGIVPVEKFAHCPPFVGAGKDRISDLEQGRGLRMPQARRGETSTGLKVEIKAGRVNVLASMGKPHGDMCFIRTFVMGKSRVAIDAKHGAARWPGIGNQMRRNLGQRRGEVGDEAQDRLADRGFPFFFVRQKPVAIVVALEAGQKAK